MNGEAKLNGPAVLEALRSLPLGEVSLMEICGTHTASIAKSGIKSMLPANIRLISGPGCPVCVTPASAIDSFLELSSRPEVMIATYGDMLRVPGSHRGDTLRSRGAAGASVTMVYSPMDALQLAKEHPDKEIVFLGVGFETTAPGTAAAVKAVAAADLRNFSVLSLLRTCPQALRALIADPNFRVQGFLCPGHVAVITGSDGFRFLPEEYGLPAVVSGFEPEDILLSVYLLCRQIAEKAPRIENTYGRAVSVQGNRLARNAVSEVFEPCDALWRGLGLIPGSGLRLRPAWERFDAEKRFGFQLPDADLPTACACGDIIRGYKSPAECPLFGKVCTPEDPVGPCMVSGEGACAAFWKYGQ